MSKNQIVHIIYGVLSSLGIVLQKAQISPFEPYRIERVKVERYQEGI